MKKLALAFLTVATYTLAQAATDQPPVNPTAPNHFPLVSIQLGTIFCLLGGTVINQTTKFIIGKQLSPHILVDYRSTLPLMALLHIGLPHNEIALTPTMRFEVNTTRLLVLSALMHLGMPRPEILLAGAGLSLALFFKSRW